MSAWVIPTDEDLMIARHVWTLLNRGRASRSALKQRELKGK